MNTKEIITKLKDNYIERNHKSKLLYECAPYDNNRPKLQHEFNEIDNTVFNLEAELNKSLKHYNLKMTDGTTIRLDLMEEDDIVFNFALFNEAFNSLRFIKLTYIYKDNERIEERTKIINLNHIIEII